MAQTGSDAPSKWGSIGISALGHVPTIPTIFAEWASLLPIASHLASQHQGFRTIGEAGLMGRLSIGLFPRLGVTDNVARFLQQGADFLDRTTSQAPHVWDVKWGSSFPASNGSASTMIAQRALRTYRQPSIAQSKQGSNLMSSLKSSVITYCMEWTQDFPRRIAAGKSVEEDDCHRPESPRRYQTLHVINLADARNRRHGGWFGTVWRIPGLFGHSVSWLCC